MRPLENLHAFYRDTWSEVDLNAIEENIRGIQKSLPDHVTYMAVVKANAYGHGAVGVAKTAVQAGAQYLGVAILDEALVLRQAGIKAPILVLGYIRPSDVELAAKYNITVTVYQDEWVEKSVAYLKEGSPKLKCHLKVDTGMGRIGIRTEKEGKSLTNRLQQHSQYFTIEGVYTHFATADELDASYIKKQHNRFEAYLNWLKKEMGVSVQYIHSGNSATALRYHEYSYNMVRVGISTYGLSPSEEVKPEIKVPLREAFSLHSRVTHIKQMPKDEGISYGATYHTKADEWVATIPIGYADGWLRANADGGEVLVKGVRAPIIGRICMDQLMISLPFPVELGTKVTLIGKQGSEIISVDEIAKRLGTINYEIPCMISHRVPRAIMNDGNLIHVVNKVF